MARRLLSTYKISTKSAQSAFALIIHGLTELEEELDGVKITELPLKKRDDDVHFA